MDSGPPGELEVLSAAGAAALSLMASILGTRSVGEGSHCHCLRMRQLGHEAGAFLAEFVSGTRLLDGDPARGDIARQVPGGPPQMARSRTSQWTRLATSSRSTSSAPFGIDVIVIEPRGIRSE